MMKLFAVFLGGNAPGSNTELHDVVFVAGQRFEVTYDDLLASWFGSPEGLHVDSWLELTVIDGHRISLQPTAPIGPMRLFFINLGAYRPGEFAEVHANMFLVAPNEVEAKARAKAVLLRGLESVHTDDLYDVDDCLEIGEVAGWHVALEPTDEEVTLQPNNGYLPLPEATIRSFVKRTRDFRDATL